MSAAAEAASAPLSAATPAGPGTSATGTASTSPVGTSSAAPRFMFIHGHGQNAETFRQKTGSIRTTLKKVFDIEFIQAPYLLDACDHSVENGLGDTYTWMEGEKGARTFTDKSFEEIHRTVQGAVGVMGFSLGGATLHHYLCKHSIPDSLKCAAFYSSFIVEDAGEFPPTLPTFHCYGDADEIITPERSAALVEKCALAEVFQHPGGHFMPSQSRKAFTEFVKKHAQI